MHINFTHVIKLLIIWWSSIVHRNHQSKILFYHDVFKTTNYKAKDADVCMGTHLELFQKHVDIILREGYSIVPQITRTEGEVAIMFDDGFRGIWECRDYFYEQGIQPTIFLPVVYIGKEGMLTKEEILELQSHGFIFECHSWSHEVLTKWNDKHLIKELRDSREYLSNLLSNEVLEICLPVGLYNEHLLDEIWKSGYTTVYSSIPGNYYELAPGGMRRRNLCQFASPSEVKMILRGGNESIKTRYERMHYVSSQLTKQQ